MGVKMCERCSFSNIKDNFRVHILTKLILRGGVFYFGMNWYVLRGEGRGTNGIIGRNEDKVLYHA